MTGLLAAFCGIGAYVVFLVIILCAMLLPWLGRKPNESADAHASAPGTQRPVMTARCAIALSDHSAAGSGRSQRKHSNPIFRGE